MSTVRVAQCAIEISCFLCGVIHEATLSGLAFGSFLVLHFATHLSTILGPESFDNSLKLYRHYYQHPIVEFGVLPAAVLIHIICGVITSRQRGGYANLSDRLFAYAGWFIVMQIGIHAYMERANALIFGSKFDANYAFVAGGMIEKGSTFMAIYFIIWAAAGLHHMIQGVIRAAGFLRLIKIQTSLELRRSSLITLVTLAAIGAVGYAVYAMVPNAVFPIDLDSLTFYRVLAKDGPEAALKL